MKPYIYYILIFILFSCGDNPQNRNSSSEEAVFEEKVDESIEYQEPIKSAPEEYQIGGYISKNTVGLYNKTNYPIKILLGIKPDLSAFEIPKNEFWISPSLSNHPQIQIFTEERKREYQLELSKKYLIFWNSQSNYWDIIELKK